MSLYSKADLGKDHWIIARSAVSNFLGIIVRVAKRKFIALRLAGTKIQPLNTYAKLAGLSLPFIFPVKVALITVLESVFKELHANFAEKSLPEKKLITKINQENFVVGDVLALLMPACREILGTSLRDLLLLYAGMAFSLVNGAGSLTPTDWPCIMSIVIEMIIPAPI